MSVSWQEDVTFCGTTKCSSNVLSYHQNNWFMFRECERIYVQLKY